MDERLRQLNWLYNQALEQRKTAYEERGEQIGYYDQCKWLTTLRATNVHGLRESAVGPQRGMLKRLDEAFKSFFRRVKAGQKPGYPRFRPISRCKTIDVTIVGRRMIRRTAGAYSLKIAGFPRIRISPACLIPDGDLASVRLTRRGRHWDASIVYAMAPVVSPGVDAPAVGIDLGVRKQLTLSDGTRHGSAIWDRKKMRRLSRAHSRCRKGSSNRRKRTASLARFHRREYIRRRNACHRITTEIVRKHGLIAVERLDVQGMTRKGHGRTALNREIRSQNWSLLRSQLRYKAEWAGREYVEVDPRYTSQDCSRCGARNPLGASEVYRCGVCGYTEDRDVNAAINILAAGVKAAGASTWISGSCVAPEPCVGDGA